MTLVNVCFLSFSFTSPTRAHSVYSSICHFFPCQATNCSMPYLLSSTVVQIAALTFLLPDFVFFYVFLFISWNTKFPVMRQVKAGQAWVQPTTQITRQIHSSKADARQVQGQAGHHLQGWDPDQQDRTVTELKTTAIILLRKRLTSLDWV